MPDPERNWKKEADELRKRLVENVINPFKKNQQSHSRLGFEKLLNDIETEVDAARRTLESLEPLEEPAPAAESRPVPGAELEVADQQRSNMTEFFTSVANSMVAAQQRLDAASQQYLASVAAKPELMPALFRIPRIKADLKFAIENVDSKKINVIFFGKEQRERVLNEQSVSFEIVAAAPPPEAPVTEAALLQLSVVYNPAVRDQVKEVVEKEAGRSTVKPLADNWDRALLVELDSPVNFAALLSLGDSAADEKDLGIWYIRLAPAQAGASAVDVVYSFLRSPMSSETTAGLRAALSAFGKKQAQYLKELAAL